MVCHYTDSKGILGILNTNIDKIVLWCTHADCLNDYSEGKNILKIYRDVIEEMHDDGEVTDEKYEKLKEVKIPKNHTFIVDGGEDEEGVKIFASLPAEYDAYICSFCQEDDLLDMWRYYSKGDVGYALSFSDCLMETNFNNDILNYISFESVIYNTEEKKEKIKNIICTHIKSFGDDDFCKIIEYELSGLKYVFKHECFKNEKEKRLIVKIPKKNNDMGFPKIKYRQGNGMLIPYIEIEFDKHCLYKVKLSPLASETAAEMTKDYVNNFMGSGYVNIDISKLPIRF